MDQTMTVDLCNTPTVGEQNELRITAKSSHVKSTASLASATAAPSGKKVPLYEVDHSRIGDEGNDLNLLHHLPFPSRC